MATLTYTKRLDRDGDVLVGSVLASDGSIVITGYAQSGGDVLDVLDGITGDKGPTEAYRAWLAAGGKVGEPTPDLRAYAAAARYAKETAGITVGTAPIATDRDSQTMITGMWAAAQINPQIQVSFKSGSGFVTIGAAQVAKIAAAVASYVQACFTAEAGVVACIASGKVKTTADVDATFAAVASTFGAPAAGTTAAAA